MERLTNVGNNGEIWIADNDTTRALGRKESAYQKLAEYEDLGLEPNEIKPYIELAEKMNVCDLVRENKKLSDKIRFLEAQKQI